MTVKRHHAVPDGEQEIAFDAFEDVFERFVEAWRTFETACHAIAIDHGFWPEEGRNEGEMIALMHSELSELLEAIRKPQRDEHIPEVSHRAIEAADLLIRLGDFTKAAQLDLPTAVFKKMQYNMGRPPKHGKEF